MVKDLGGVSNWTRGTRTAEDAIKNQITTKVQSCHKHTCSIQCKCQKYRDSGKDRRKVELLPLFPLLLRREVEKSAGRVHVFPWGRSGTSELNRALSFALMRDVLPEGEKLCSGTLRGVHALPGITEKVDVGSAPQKKAFLVLVLAE